MDYRRDLWQEHMDAFSANLEYGDNGINTKESMRWAKAELLEMRETLASIRVVIGDPKPDESPAIARIREMVTWQLRSKL